MNSGAASTFAVAQCRMSRDLHPIVGVNCSPNRAASAKTPCKSPLEETMMPVFISAATNSRGTDLNCRGGTAECLQSESIDELKLVQRRVPDGLSLHQRCDQRAVGLGVVEFDQATGIQVDQKPLPLASETTWLSGVPGGASPQMLLARARKSGLATGSGGRRRATTLSCWVTCTSSPASTHLRICGHCCRTCSVVALFIILECRR